MKMLLENIFQEVLYCPTLIGLEYFNGQGDKDIDISRDLKSKKTKFS